jgi:hypothetical protein
MQNRRRAMYLIATLAMLIAPARAFAQNQIVYAYAALLDSAGNHYIPINYDTYPPMGRSGWAYFINVEFRFTDRTTNAPVVLVVNSNDPGVSHAGWVVRNDARIPTAWLIKAELLPQGGAPRQLTASVLGQGKFFIAYDPSRYTFNEITLQGPDGNLGGARLVRRETAFADLPDIPGGNVRFDFARPYGTPAVQTGTSTKPVAPASVQGIKPTIPVIKH